MRQTRAVMVSVDTENSHVGKARLRQEDAALLRGAGQFVDDLGTAPGTLHAAFVRSPHAHAEIAAVDCAAAAAMPGVAACITRDDVQRWTAPFIVGVKQPMRHWCLAVDRVRYVGEPVVLICATDRYLAEDAADAVEVRYRPLPAVVDPLQALGGGAPILHPDVGGNVVSDRHFSYGDPETVFRQADHIFSVAIEYPRNSVTPIECYGAVARYDAGTDGYDIQSNFSGPFALHPVMALALKLPGNRLNLRNVPDSGGSFGTKQGIFPYLIALALAARKSGRPVKWIEDRLEHLMAATSATNRVTTLRAAVRNNGVIEALDYDQLDDCGGYLRAPEPATVYRMHGNMTGAYAIQHVKIRNRIVLTNKTPSGLVRGFGGPQVYFALERLTHTIAERLDLPHWEIMRRNWVPENAFPFTTATGGILDSGRYAALLDRVEEKGILTDLCQRRQVARDAGKLYGIGAAAIVEPSISNMGYITTVLTAEERERAGPKGGAVASASAAVDPLGGVRVHVASVPQGQGHRTVLQQVTADIFGIAPDAVTVSTELQTSTQAWSVASGNYSSRFAGAVAGAAHLAGMRLRGRIADLAAEQLDCGPDDVIFADGRVYARQAPDKALPFRRVAAGSHWAEGTRPQGSQPVIQETVFWSPDGLKAPNAGDEINSSAAHGFVLDLCGVEICRDTGAVHVDRYVTAHDAGRLLNPALAEGQIRGGFSNGLGAALYESFDYAADGSFLSGTFADYVVPGAAEMPALEILHQETHSPVTPLGAKGLGEGNCMSTPVTIANAVADALKIDQVTLPLTPARVLALLAEKESPAPVGMAVSSRPALSKSHYALSGQGERRLPAAPAYLWQNFTDAERLARVLPGCEELSGTPEAGYQGVFKLGVGAVAGRFRVRLVLSELKPPHSLRLSGRAEGFLGTSQGDGVIQLTQLPDGDTEISYHYGVDLSGRVAAVGARMLSGAAETLIGHVFQHMAGDLAPAVSTEPRTNTWLTWLKKFFRWPP